MKFLYYLHDAWIARQGRSPDSIRSYWTGETM